MIVESCEPTEQEATSCRVSITGISCSQTFYPNLSEAKNSKFPVLDLAKAALADDGYDGKINPVEKISVVVCNYVGSPKANQTNDGIHSFSAHHLADELGLLDETKHFDEQISNPLQGLKIAAYKLQLSRPDAVLLIIDDIDFSVFILRRVEDALGQHKRIYASIMLLTELNKSSDINELDAKYRQAGILPKSINLLTLKHTSTALTLKSQVSQLAQFFSEKNGSQREDQNTIGLSVSRQDPWCSLRTISSLEEKTAFSISPILETILSLQQKVFLPIISENIIEQIDLKKSPFYFNITLRPWFFPQIHAQLRKTLPQPDYNLTLRRAALHIVEENGTTYHMVAEECEDVDEAKRRDLQPDWPSEIFTFFAADRLQLADHLQSISDYLQVSRATPLLKDLAFTINTQTAKLIDQSLHSDNSNGPNEHSKVGSLRVAFVCSTLEELLEKLQIILIRCRNTHLSIERQSVLKENQDIYWNIQSVNADPEQNKLAFVLPGLGAAYPNMLVQLCLHFPEVRAIFDYVDALSSSSDNQVKPSDRIFSRIDHRTKSVRETPASLAVMDSAVITVLMAEWAIFTLLLNMGIVADALLGCSTGEFAALTMSGAVDILKAAPLFYHLSTGMVRALPLEQLINLRSLKVAAPIESIKDQLDKLSNKVYLSANLSPNQLIITGDKESINTLAKSFENDNITADFLPFAIPYHTPLVSGVVSLSNPDIQALQITNPLIESWSCSLAAPYPAQSEEIRKMTTNLFSKPILFRESIEALYKKGVRTFIEVGPRGNLAPVISEILNERPHTSLAANRSDIAAITQLHHVLAALFTNAVYMDLAYLYARRSPILLSIDKISSFNPLTERLGKEQSLAKTLYTSNQTVQKRNISLENVRGEITTIDQAIVALSDSFQNQLEQLERQVMSHFNAQKVYRLDNEGNGRRSHYLSQEIILKNTFTDIGDDLCAAIVCRQVRVDTLPDKEAELFSLANSLLTPAEISIFSSFRQLSKRKEWLAGRIAAKEATKTLVQKPSGKAIDYMDMQIDCLPSGKPYLNVNNEMHKYPISITHKDGQVIAVAADGSKLSSIGIDLESLILDDGLENFILNATERKYIEHLSGQERSYYIKCIWSAKEATAKALGLGLSDCLTKLSIADEIYGKNQFSIDCSAARSEKANEFIKVHIGVLDNMIISLVAGDI